MSSVLRSSLLNIAATAVSLACGFLVNIAVARLLGPAGSGTVAFMLWLAIAASAIADLGLPQTVLRYLSLTEHFDDFQKGIVDTKHVIYYLSFMAFGLFLTAKSVDSERWRG